MSDRKGKSSSEPKIKKKVKKDEEDEKKSDESALSELSDLNEVSDNDSDKPKKSKKTSKKEEPTKEKKPGKMTIKDNEILIDLNKKKKVAIRKFKNMVLIDIREYWEKDGEELPTKKGVSLTLDTWKELKNNIETIDEAITGIH